MPNEKDKLERLISEHLEQEAARVDSASLWQRLKSQLAADAEVRLLDSARPGQGAGWARWGLALAASIALLLLGSLNWTTSSAQAESLVREVQARQRTAVDRRYEIRTEILGRFGDRFPLLKQGGYECIHIRGSAFWVEARKHQPRWLLARPGLRWGRDPDGNYWLTLGPRQGLRFEADEVPEAFSFFIAIRGADVDGILSGLLADCQLTLANSSDPRLVRIQARRKPTRPGGTIASAELTVWRDTREVEELVLHRVFLNQPLAKVHLKRLADLPQPDANYRLETHLLKGVVPLDRQQAARRNEVFRGWLREAQRGPVEEQAP